MIIVLLLVILSQIYGVLSQIASSARLQPWPLSIQHMGTCCPQLSKGLTKDWQAHSQETTSLLHCLNASANATNKRAHAAIFTYVHAEVASDKHFAVPDIMKYAAYHAGIITAYAEQNNYMYRFLTSDTPGHSAQELEPADVRWNKVKLLIQALDPEIGWAREMKYIVWIDADAIILDMGMKLEKIAEEQYPRADFIASADIRQGYINSGFLLVRNTAWARTFLERWWNIVDRSQVCDQDAFDMVYSEYNQSEKLHQPIGAEQAVGAKVAILRRDALNTDPPATLRQQPHNQVLHLMGESSDFRAEVFRQALSAICDARTGGVLPAQLGLYRKYLEKLALSIYKKDTANRLLAAKEQIAAVLPQRDGETVAYGMAPEHVRSVEEGEEVTVAADGSATAAAPQFIQPMRSDKDLLTDVAAIVAAPAMFEGIGRSTHHLCDLLMAHGNQRQEVYAVRTQVLALVFRWLERSYAVLNLLKSRIADNSALSTSEVGVNHRRAKNDLVLALLQLLKRAAEAGNDVFGAAESEEDKRAAADKTFHVLEELHGRLDRTSQAVSAHMMALMHQNMAYLEYDIAVGLPTGKDVEEDLDSQSQIMRNIPRKQARRRAELFRSALVHAESSVQLFDEYLSESQDRSVINENIHSLQILAAVHCTEARNLTRGLIIWERTVDLAGAAMRGVYMGPALDIYGGILHNAAVCFQQEGSAAALRRAAIFAKEAVSARELYSRQQGIPMDSQNALNSNELLQMSRELVENIKSKRLERGLDSRESEEHEKMPLSASGASTEPLTFGGAGQTKVYKESDFSEEEWEECQEGEEGCEAFFVADDMSTLPTSQDGMQDVKPPETIERMPDNSPPAAQTDESPPEQPKEKTSALHVDVSVGIAQLKLVSKPSKGLRTTLDRLDAFMQQLSEQHSSSNPSKTQPSANDAKGPESRAKHLNDAPISMDKRVGDAGPVILPRDSAPPSDTAAGVETDDVGVEWVECEEGEEGCEDVYVKQEQEQDDDVIEARKLWARQTALFQEGL